MIKVQRQDFNAGAEIRAFLKSSLMIGGLVTFIGLVRDRASEETITAMTLEHYPGMTERKLAEIEREARLRWELEDVLVIHRYGRLKPGDQIVLVLTAATHRAPAFAASEFLVDWLKTKAPFWKQEETSMGMKWVESRDSDEQAASRWTGK